MGHFQKDIRKTLLQYALTPIFVLAILWSFVAIIIWQHDVERRSQDTRHLAAEVLYTMIQDYSFRADYVVSNELLAHGSMDIHQQRKLYEWLYHEVNIAHDGTLFYLLDGQGNVLMGNRKQLPEYLLELPRDWGVWQRMQQSRDKAVVEFSPRIVNANSDLLIGRSIWRDNKLQGYLLFVIPGAYIEKNISSTYVAFALVNEFGYASIVTNPVMQEGQFQRLTESFEGRQFEIATKRREDYYITYEDLGDTGFRLYSAMPVGELEQRYQLAAAILLVVLLIMVPLLWYRVRQESRVRIKAADDLIDAFSALKQGDWQREMVLDGPEFAVVAETYNRMVHSLQRLMKLNEARAKANAVSEVRQLEAQFNPHFLFNTLENIKFMVKLEPEAAVKMIVSLSSLLRYCINNLMQQVTLAEDWQYTMAYLDIIKYRFGHRLSCKYDVQVDLEQVYVPKLIMQPILENAIKYGEAEDGTISLQLAIYAADNMLYIKVQNAGPEIAPEKLAQLHELLHSEANSTRHIGIYNVHKRLKLLYGAGFGLSISSKPGEGTTVELRLPLVMKKS